jgi:hypothetical protein
MPYTTIHWIKLEIRLLNDPRFFLMSEEAQLLFVKLLMVFAHFRGKTQKNWTILRQILRTSRTESELEKSFEEIRTNFPKVLVSNGYISIKDFKKRHNWVSPEELPGNSQGTPKDSQDKEKIKIRIDIVIRELIKQQNWEEALKTNPNLLSDTYTRHARSAKKLILAVGEVKSCEAIRKMAESYKTKGLSWTLETVLRHLPELLKEEPKRRVLQ